MTLSEFIRQYRADHHLSQRQLARLCGLSNGYISMLEKGINPNTHKPIIPTLPRLNQLARGMSLTLEELLEEADDMPVNLNFSSDSSNSIISLPKLKKLPLISKVSCDQPILAQAETYLELPCRIGADFAMICRGDSMINARIYDGDIIYIRQQSSVNDGEIASVLIDGAVTLKRVFFYEDHTVLAPDNPMYRPISYWDDQRNDLRILGKAVAFLGTIR